MLTVVRRLYNGREEYLMPKRPAPSKKPPLRTLHLLCDSTGNLPRHMVAAFATQFPPGSLTTREWNFIASPSQLQDLHAALKADPGIVFHAFVSDALKCACEDFCRGLNLPCRDLTGGFVQFLAENTGLRPMANPQRLHEMDETYHSRVRALEFALQHDDGLGLDSIAEADMVLTGISRTGKTPTAIYLAQQGYRAANVSLALEVEPPRQLLELDPAKVVALTIEPDRLLQIRTGRQMEWKMSGTSYNDPDHVTAEVRWARKLFNRRGWLVLDVTNRAIEETAARVIEFIGKRPRGGETGESSLTA